MWFKRWRTSVVFLPISFVVGCSLVHAGSAASAQPCVYVANSDSATVSVIDGRSNVLTATIPVAAFPTGVAATTDGRAVYVTNRGGTVTVIETATNTVGANIPAGQLPSEIALSPDDSAAYVTNDFLEGVGAPGISVIDTAAGVVSYTMYGLAGELSGIALTPNGAFAYVTSYRLERVLVIDTARLEVVASIRLAPLRVLTRPYGVATSPDGKFAYVTDNGADAIAVISTETNSVTSWIRDLRGYEIAIRPDGAFLYATDSVADVVRVVDLSQGVQRTPIPVGKLPWKLAFAPDGHFAYVTDLLDHAVYVIDATAHRLAGRIPVGQGPKGVAVASVPSVCCGPCVGDCNHDDRVVAAELVQGVRIALGTAEPDTCASFDINGDRSVTSDELRTAVHAVFGSR